MLNLLINFIFTIVSKIGDLVLLPVITFLSALIPGFSDFYNGIISFIDYGLTYFLFFIKLLCIPQICMTAVLTIATATLTITLGIRTYTLIMRIYKNFKP